MWSTRLNYKHFCPFMNLTEILEYVEKAASEMSDQHGMWEISGQLVYHSTPPTNGSSYVGASTLLVLRVGLRVGVI